MVLDRDSALRLIRSSIETRGWHTYVVSGGDPLPRFAYTIGLSKLVGHELVLAGASFYLADQVIQIIDSIASSLLSHPSVVRSDAQVFSLGTFDMRPVAKSWIELLLLGATDYYATNDIDAMQIVPDENHRTIDVPNLSKPWTQATEPVWQWLHLPWKYDVPAGSTVTTNLAALKGARVTEASRWEVNHWEMFAGSGGDTPRSEARVIPLGTLVAADETLGIAVDLKVGKSLWRDESKLEWHEWG